MLTLTRISNFKYHFQGAPKDERIVRNVLSVFVEGSQFSTAFRDFGWDGKHKFYNGRNNTFLFGLIEIVRKELTDKSVKFQIIDEIELARIDCSTLSLKLYTHQKEAITEFFEKNFGIICIPTRGGKTFTAAEGIKLVTEQIPNSNVLFVVDGVDLLHQTIDEIASYLNISKKHIGIIQGEHFEPKQITVATVQTLQSIVTAKFRKSKKTLSAEDYRKKINDLKLRKVTLLNYFKTVNFGIFDEIHECMSSDDRLALLKHFNFSFLLGLSATPYKKGEVEGSMNYVTNLNLLANFGGIVYVVEEQILRDRGVLAKDKVLLLLVPHEIPKHEREFMSQKQPEQSAKRYQFYENRIIFHNAFRDSIVLQLISIVRKLKIKTLLLFESIEHGKNIEKLSGEKFLFGENNKDERKYYTKHFLSGKGKILLASGIYRKGITLPEVQILINVDGGKEDSLIIQRRGRAIGATDSKQHALIIDLADEFEEFFSEHSLNRIKVYEERIGLENIDVLNVLDIDFHKTLQDYLANWQNVKT